MNEQRESFENYMRKQNPCVRLARQTWASGGEYRTATVDRAWKLWQASWMTATYEAKKPGASTLLPLPVLDHSLLEVGK